jgi:hypothetical protein
MKRKPNQPEKLKSKVNVKAAPDKESLLFFIKFKSPLPNY